jgi:CheY-like chemotaxis protein
LQRISLAWGWPFDTVVCDLNMPEMRGDVVLASAIELGFDPGRFILMTGNGVEVMGHFRGQCPKVLEKPYTRRQLEGAIRQVTAAAIE